MYLKQSLLAGLVIGSFLIASTAEAKFLSVDPVQFDPNNPRPGMFNRYSYTLNDPINGIDPFGLDTVIVMKANPIGKAPMTGVYGHAFIQYRDTNTGETRISRAGPSAPYPGGASDAVKGKTFSGVNLITDDSVAKGSVDFNKPSAVDVQSVTVPDDIGVVTSQLKSFNDSVDKSNIPYNPKAQNSNTYAGDAFEAVTGVEPKNTTNVDLHGLKNDLPIKKPTP